MIVGLDINDALNRQFRVLRVRRRFKRVTTGATYKILFPICLENGWKKRQFVSKKKEPSAYTPARCTVLAFGEKRVGTVRNNIHTA